MLKKIIKDRWSYLFLAPWLGLFLVFIFTPFVMGFLVSFTEYNFVDYKFTFLDNYKQVLGQNLFPKALLTTFTLAIFIVPITMGLALWIANFIKDAKRITQTIVKAAIYIPSVVSGVALIITWKWIFNPAFGLSVYITKLLDSPTIDWYGVTRNALFLIILLIIIIGIGVAVILYSGAITAIPKSLYEAAEVDGATELQKFIRITFPLVKPTTLYLSIMGIIGGLQIFEVPLLLTSGGPSYGTTTVMLLLYKTAFEFERFGRAAAIGVILFIIIGIFSIIQFRVFRSDVQY